MSLLRRHSTRKSSILKKSQSKSQDVEYTALDIPSLRRRRTIAFKRMSKALEIGVAAVNDRTQRDMFFSYHQEIKKIASNFEDAHFAILEILDDPENDDSELQEHFDEMYYKVISIYRSLNKIESCAPQPSCSSLSNVRLPKIQLPTFAGDIKRFPEYFDTFNALIHNSTSLSDTEKFHYLISSLSGDALTVVKTFPLSSEYYRDAYDALIARYKCKRELAFTCWREILTVNFNFKNAYEFRKSLDLFEENLCILKSINLPVNHWDFVLVYHLLSKLDTNLRRDFEEKYSNTELPSYSQLKEFLHSKCEALLRDTHFTEQANQNKTTTQKVNYQSVQSKRVTTSHALIAADEGQSEASSSMVVTRPAACSFCNESHSISSCPAFLEMSIDERMKIATDRNWCYNCLKSSHQLRNCTSIFSCRTCKRKHHSLLHRQASNEPNETVSALISRSQSNTTVLLATAIVQIKDASGRMQSLRALFDTGSQGNFITESAVKRLNLKQSRAAATVNGLGEAAASILGDVTCSIGTNEKSLFELDLHVLSQICGDQPIANLNTSGWSHIKTLPLADPDFDIPGPIDLLFAADVFAESLLNEHIKGSSNQPTALKSVFGWLLLGKTGLATTTPLQSSEIKPESSLLAQRFWDIESLPSARPLSANEFLCEQKGSSEHSINNSGRDILLCLPFKGNSEPFVRSRDAALRPFHAVERRLSRNSIVHSQYTNLMSDYTETGVISHVASDELKGEKYCIPHHCPESATIHTSVVFDASAEDINSWSLNNTQLIGPEYPPNIIEIFLRFLEHILFIANASLIYRHILISPEHRDCQRNCWRASPHESRKEYRQNTVTCGVASSHFLTYRTLQGLTETEEESYSIKKLPILSDVYVVDAINFRSDAPFTLSTLLSMFTRWAKFVANRITRLRDSTPINSWHQISSADDPIDIILFSLEHFPSQLFHNMSWWAGPRGFSEEHEPLNSNRGMLSFEKEAIVNMEARKAVVLVTEPVQDTEARKTTVIDKLQNRHTSLQNINNALNYINHIVNNSLYQLFVNRNNLLNNVDQHNALMKIVKHAQSQAVNTGEISNTRANKPLLNQIRKGTPFLDSQGISVDGRTSRSSLEFEQNHPAFLLSDYRLTVLAIVFIYRHSYLPGIDTPNFLLLQQFGITSAKRAIPRGLSKYVQFDLSNPQPFQPFMSDLPQVNWTKNSKPLKIESMVIIKNEIRSPLHRSLGRFMNLIPIADGAPRIAVLRTATNNQIPLVNSCPLPTEG